MRVRRLLLCAVLPAIGAASAAEAGAVRHHRRHHHAVGYSPAEAVPGVVPGAVYVAPPLAGTAGIAIPPEAARFMGYPYNVPGYRYAGYDACLLRVGGPFGPGPSAGPCPFGLQGLY